LEISGRGTGGGKDSKKTGGGTKPPEKKSDTDNQKKPFKKFRFVQQWPKDKVYISKNGNKLSQECEKHFEGFCFRCGHNSHTYDKCKVYPEKTVCITICSVCAQGFHETCRRKWAKEAQISKQIQQLGLFCNHMSQSANMVALQDGDGYGN